MQNLTQKSDKSKFEFFQKTGVPGLESVSKLQKVGNLKFRGLSQRNARIRLKVSRALRDFRHRAFIPRSFKSMIFQWRTPT